MMKKPEKLFGGLHMGWGQVILFSLAVGVFCGIFGGLPALTDTSFTDMAGGYEWWVVFAVIIVASCGRPLDAGLKCGLFFLITQPLQFFIQAMLYSHAYANAWMYFKLWLPVIIATVPGGMIAWLVKKQTWYGALVMGLGNTIEGVMLVSYARAFLAAPPRHLIACLVSLGSIPVMTLALQRSAKRRIIAFVVPVILTAALVAYALANGLTI